MKSTLLIGLLLAWTSGPIAAQEMDLSTASVADLLDRFVEEQMDREGSEAFQQITRILLGRTAERPQSDVGALIDGLADLVLNAPTPWVRSVAVSVMAVAGKEGAANPDPAIGPRLVRLFRETRDPLVRSMILGVFKTQVNRSVGRVLFREVLTEDRSPFANTGEARVAAAEALKWGEEGLALLRELHAAGTIKDRDAREWVQRWNSEGRLGGGR